MKKWATVFTILSKLIESLHIVVLPDEVMERTIKRRSSQTKDQIVHKAHVRMGLAVKSTST